MLDGEQGILLKFTYLLGNILCLLLAVYKCHSMGILPTAPSDWLAFKEHRQVWIFMTLKQLKRIKLGISANCTRKISEFINDVSSIARYQVGQSTWVYLIMGYARNVVNKIANFLGTILLKFLVYSFTLHSTQAGILIEKNSDYQHFAAFYQNHFCVFSQPMLIAKSLQFFVSHNFLCRIIIFAFLVNPC